MANRVRGEVAVEINGKTWTLRYSANALCELEEAVGKPVNAIMQMLQNGESLRIKTIRSVVWAGLRDRHPEVTEVEAGELITAVGFSAMMVKVGEALTAAFPDDVSAAGKGEQETRPQ